MHLRSELLAWFRALLVGLGSAFLLLCIAFVNGYPTFFSDTGSYLLTGAFLRAFAPFRAPGYSIFTRYASLGVSAWPIVIAQALIVAYVLFELCAWLASSKGREAARFVGISVLLLTVFTGLPWLVSQIMPDVFAGLALICAFLLAFAADLMWLRRIALALILLVSVAAHTSLLPICAAFAGILVLLRRQFRMTLPLPGASAALALVLVPMLVAGFGTAGLNESMGLGFRLAPGGDSFLLARLFGDGLAARYLHENCPAKQFISCRYLANLPQSQEQFLFYSPLIRGLKGHEDEMAQIVHGAIAEHPLRFAVNSIGQSLLQFVTVRTGDEIRATQARSWNNGTVQQVFPSELPAFLNDRQMRGQLLTFANVIGVFDAGIIYLSLLACIFMARTGRLPRLNAFFYCVLAFLAVNAAFCATLVGVYDRYQSRVAWLLPFCLIAYAYCWAEEWGPSGLGELLVSAVGVSARTKPAPAAVSEPDGLGEST